MDTDTSNITQNIDSTKTDPNANKRNAETTSYQQKQQHQSNENISFSDNNSFILTDYSAEAGSSPLNSMKSFISSDTELTEKTEIIHIPPSERIQEIEDNNTMNINIHTHNNTYLGENENVHNTNIKHRRWNSILRSKSTKEHVKVPLDDVLEISLDKNEKGAGLDVEAPSQIIQDHLDHTPPAATNLNVNVIIDENHDNYVLMYDMLTGIRTCVSRCEAKPWRPLQEGDFFSTHKLAFDLSGGDETPSSRYDFKFKDYSPWVFRSLREAFLIDAADYLVSLTSKYVLSELYSPGKSGSLFYYSQDYRFIIKTIRESEHLFLRKILPKYYQHMKNNYKNTLLVRFYGLHRVQVGGKKIYFVVMGNIFPSTASLRAIYDLKGSTQGRWSTDELNNTQETENINTEQDCQKSHGPKVLKDLNWLSRRENLVLGPLRATDLMTQLKIDCKFLAKSNIMDYSLLIGLRDCALNDDSWTGTDDRIPFTFYKDFEGFRSSFQDNSPGPEIYYLGIIDILTPYSAKKRLEHFFKSIVFSTDSISAVNPLNYAKRFLKFMNENILQNVNADYNRRDLPQIPECEIEHNFRSPECRCRNRSKDNESESDFIIVNVKTDE